MIGLSKCEDCNTSCPSDCNYSLELWRLSTFKGYSNTSLCSAILLARQGFVYFGVENSNYDMCLCVFCYFIIIVNSLAENSDIEEFHRKYSPHCPLVKGLECGNVVIEKSTTASFSQLDQMNTGEEQAEVLSAGAGHFSTDTVPMFSQESAINGQEHSSHSHSPDEGSPSQSTMSANRSSSSNSQIIQPLSPGILTSECGPTDNSIVLGFNRPLSTRPHYASLDLRRESFGGWPSHHHISPNDLARAGYFYTGYSDCVRCFYCGGGFRNWQVGDDIWVEHAKGFPKCAFLRERLGQVFIDNVQILNQEKESITYKDVLEKIVRDECGRLAPASSSSHIASSPEGRENVGRDSISGLQNSIRACGGGDGPLDNLKLLSSDSSIKDLGIITTRPRMFGLASEGSRHKTFAEWPSNHPVKSEDLVKCGFFYTGYADYVTCFYCGGSIHNLAEQHKGDQIWIVHATYYPECGFICRTLGSAFVKVLQDLSIKKEAKFNGDGKGADVDKDLEDKSLAMETMDDDDVPNNAGDHGALKELTLEEQRDLLETERNYRKQKITCQICLEREVATLFLPCSHVACSVCAANISHCHKCGQSVQGLIDFKF